MRSSKESRESFSCRIYGGPARLQELKNFFQSLLQPVSIECQVSKGVNLSSSPKPLPPQPQKTQTSSTQGVCSMASAGEVS